MAQPLKFKCTSCGRVIAIPAPGVAGVFNVKCPHCERVLKIKYNPKPIQMAPSQPTQNPAPQAPKKDDAVEQARHAPTQRFGSLGEMLTATGGSPAPHGVSSHAAPASNLPKLSLVRIGMDKMYFTLHEGDNTIGRKDPTNPVDVEIEGDGTISRKSVVLHVERCGAQYACSLSVLKATNPVMVNNVTVPVGQTAAVAIGSSICLGQTVLRLEK